MLQIEHLPSFLFCSFRIQFKQDIVHNFLATSLTVPRQLRSLESMGVVVWLLCNLWRRPEEAGERLQGVQECQQLCQLLTFFEVQDPQLSFTVENLD